MTNASSTSSSNSSNLARSIYNSSSIKIMGPSSSSYHSMMVVRYMTIMLLPFCFLSSSYNSSRSFAFVPTVTQQQQNQRGRRINVDSSSSSLAVSSSTSFFDNKNKDKSDGDGVPTVEFIDPQTGCEVVLLGCFHGTESSAKDVQHVITPETDVVVLELCQKRFDDLQSWVKEEEEEKEKEEQLMKSNNNNNNNNQETKTSADHKKPWMIAYMLMIQKTIHERGLSTGLAEAVLIGLSGFQTALSGFSPGLEFKTALECAQQNNAEIVLADRDVDETLKQIGNIPQISFDMLFSQNNGDNAKIEEEEENEYQLHATTLQRAVFGPSSSSSFHPVQLGHVLVRSTAAVQDLIRLTIPPTFLYFCFIQIILSISPTTTIPTMFFPTADDFVAVGDVAAAAATTTTSTITTSSSSVEEMILHLLASFCILSFGYFGIALPSVRVILTERDQCLAEGIQQACSRAGKNGRVVAVLGLLHLNGVATRMMNSSGGIGVGDFDDDHHANVVNLNGNNQQE